MQIGKRGRDFVRPQRRWSFYQTTWRHIPDDSSMEHRTKTGTKILVEHQNRSPVISKHAWEDSVKSDNN